MKCGIYKITNPKGKVYIGKSKNIELRFKSYLKLRHCFQQRKLYNSLKKYGPNNHIYEIIILCSYEQLDINEIKFIKEYQSIKLGLNLTEGGDGGKLCPESEKLRRDNSMTPVLQYDLEGNFIQEHKGASYAIKTIGRGNPNNINDCARGKYKSTYGYQWLYKEPEGEVKQKIPPYKPSKTGAKWTEERKINHSHKMVGRKKTKEEVKKASEKRIKKIYQYDIDNNLINVFKNFGSFDKSGIIGTKKLRSILNKNIPYKGLKYYNYKL